MGYLGLQLVNQQRKDFFYWVDEFTLITGVVIIMANEEHFRLIKQGVNVWNQWRVKSLESWMVEIQDSNFNEVNFITMMRPNLSEADLRAANLIEANLIAVDLSGADLSEADLRGADLRGADLRRTCLIGAKLFNAKLNGASLNYANLGAANLNEVDLRLANLTEARLDGTNFDDANLMGANLQEADLHGASLNGANLFNANLSGTNFSEANLSVADLRDANLSEAKLNNADLTLTDLCGANLNGADFRGTVVSGTRFGDIDLSGIIGLELVKHLGPSTVGVDTIYRSVSSVACRTFLQQAGVQPHLLDYIEKTRTPTDCFYTPEQIKHWIQEAKKRLEIYQNNSNIVKERMAQKGAFKQVPDVNELGEYERIVKEIEEEIIVLQEHQEKGCPVCADKISKN
jgi:uncharacterized protein YjbI with pentapeptide repeats